MSVPEHPSTPEPQPEPLGTPHDGADQVNHDADTGSAQAGEDGVAAGTEQEAATEQEPATEQDPGTEPDLGAGQHAPTEPDPATGEAGTSRQAVGPDEAVGPEQAPATEEAATTDRDTGAEEGAATEQADATEGAGAQPAAAEESPEHTPKPTPKPSSVPKPSMLARPRPGAPTAPAAPAAASPPPARSAPAQIGGAEAPMDPEQVAAAAEFGKVDDDGTVYVKEPSGDRVVGQYPGVSADEAMALYIRRYLDLKAQLDLFAARLGQLGAKDLDATLATLGEAITEPAVVGDLQALRDQVAALEAQAQLRKAELAADRAAAKEKALAERNTIVERAEKIAERDPARIQWRQDGQRLRELLEQWKQAQRSGPRLDRGTEDALWKRFSAARTHFDRVRRQYFAELDRVHAEVKATKEKLIARAEAMNTSTDWGGTSAAYRELMEEWKRAGRASRKDDDALWARFRAAQDVFFEARQAANKAIDAEYGENLKVKEQLLTEAETLVPVRDLDRAKAALRDIQDRWEAAGKVPRADIGRVEGRLRAVEQAIRDVEQAQWRKSNPRVRARAEGAAAQLEAAIEGLQKDLARAEASGDEQAIAKASDALAARKAWLEQVLQAADDAR